MNRIHALVLAAGAGSRFGGAKLTHPWREGVLLDGALAAALAAPVDTVTVVTGADPRVDEILRGRADARLRLVHAGDHGAGLSASLKAGIAGLPADAVGALVFLGDMPSVPHRVAAPLVEALLAGADAAAPFVAGRRGHPAALSARLFAAVAELQGDRGAGRVLDALGAHLVRIEIADTGVLHDVDRRQDLDRSP